MRKEKTIHMLLVCSFTFYAVFVTWNILFKYVLPTELFSGERYFARSLNLIPFHDLMEGNYNKLDIWGNILLFFPLGIYLKIWMRKKWYCLLLPAFAASVAFETLQYVFAIGASDITDVIYNTFGCFIGIGSYNLLKCMMKKEERIRLLIAILSCLAMIFVFGIVILLSWYN